MKKFCPNCGKHFEENAVVCSYCAVELKPVTAEEAEDKPKKKISGKSIAIIVTAIVLVIAIIAAIIIVPNINGDKEESVQNKTAPVGENGQYAEQVALIETYLEGLLNGDIDKCKETVGPEVTEIVVVNGLIDDYNEFYDYLVEYRQNYIDYLDENNIHYDINNLYESIVKDVRITDIKSNGNMNGLDTYYIWNEIELIEPLSTDSVEIWMAVIDGEWKIIPFTLSIPLEESEIITTTRPQAAFDNGMEMISRIVPEN